MVAALSAATIVGCSKDDHGQDYNPLIDDPKEEEQQPADDGGSATAGYDELYRPQIHYTPAKNWINDPNGLVCVDGVTSRLSKSSPNRALWP